MLKKVLIWGAIAFLVFFVAFQPSYAGKAIGALGSTAAEIFLAIGRFFGSLVG